MSRLHPNYRKLPLFFDQERYPKTDFMLVNLASKLIWALRLIVPAAWILWLFQIPREGGAAGSTVTSPRATEVYQLCALMLTGVTFILVTYLPYCTGVVWLAVVFLVECLQYQFFSIVLRPGINKNFKPYNVTRTLLLILIQYLQVMLAFAVIYFGWYRFSFASGVLTWHGALEFSALTMTTVSFGTIVPISESGAAAFAVLQAFTGVFFLGASLATTLARARRVEEVGEGP
jgi:hypothetical protein